MEERKIIVSVFGENKDHNVHRHNPGRVAYKIYVFEEGEDWQGDHIDPFIALETAKKLFIEEYGDTHNIVVTCGDYVDDALSNTTNKYIEMFNK